VGRKTFPLQLKPKPEHRENVPEQEDVVFFVLDARLRGTKDPEARRVLGALPRAPMEER